MFQHDRFFSVYSQERWNTSNSRYMKAAAFC